MNETFQHEKAPPGSRSTSGPEDATHLYNLTTRSIATHDGSFEA